MKKAFTAILLALISFSAFSQVEVSKFKFSKDEPLGMYPGRKMIDVKFKNTSDKAFKYIKFHYYAINRVGDVISGVERGITEEGKEFIKPKKLECTGPFECGKNYSQWAGGVITVQQKDVIAFPYQIEIIYMGSNESVFIDITKDNINKFFPKLKWIDYNRYNSAM